MKAPALRLCSSLSLSLVYTDCQHASNISGIYSINPDGQGAFDVYCDQNTTGGGWTVFQRRMDGSVHFYRQWNEYKNGFGNLTGEFWLGLEKVHRLTKHARCILRVELEDLKMNRVFANYDGFNVSNETSGFELSLGYFEGKFRHICDVTFLLFSIPFL